MTPVQLPEVPAREVVAHHIHGTEAEVLAFRLDMRNLLPGDLIGQSVHVLTADQLRAYATEAVMAERARLRTAVADYMHSEGCSCCRGNDHDEHKAVIAGLLGVAPYSDNSGFDFAPYRTGATQPEQNSGR